MADRDSIHRTLDAVGLRAHATAVGLVQLTCELRRCGILDGPAVERIKEAMIEEICFSRPRTTTRSEFEADIRERIDRVFAGEQQVGPTSALTGSME